MKFQRIVYSVTFYVLLMTLVIMWKPEMLFDKDGDIRRYGVEHGNTIFSFGVVSIVLAIACFYAFALIDFLFA
jgi:hypothetical protein